MGRPLLREENIVVGLEARTREEALQRVVDALSMSSLQGIEKRKILKLLILREQMGTTAIGNGMAFPHCFSQEVHEPVLAFGVSPSGVPFSSLDGELVHFIFLMILPQSEEAEHQKRQILQNIKWVLCDRYAQERLKAAHLPSEIYQLLVPEHQQSLVFEV